MCYLRKRKEDRWKWIDMKFMSWLDNWVVIFIIIHWEIICLIFVISHCRWRSCHLRSDRWGSWWPLQSNLSPWTKCSPTYIPDWSYSPLINSLLLLQLRWEWESRRLFERMPCKRKPYLCLKHYYLESIEELRDQLQGNLLSNMFQYRYHRR